MSQYDMNRIAILVHLEAERGWGEKSELHGPCAHLRGCADAASCGREKSQRARLIVEDIERRIRRAVQALHL